MGEHVDVALPSRGRGRDGTLRFGAREDRAVEAAETSDVQHASVMKIDHMA